MKPLLYTAILNLIFLSALSHTIYAQVYVNWEWEANHGLPDTLDWTATTLDLSGNLLMTGNTQTAEEMTNILTTKYDSEGDLLWEEAYNYSSDGRDYGIAITTDASNNVYVAGASFDSTTLSFDYVVIKYDSDGEELWVSRYNGSDSLDDIPVAIIVDGDENVYVTGGSSDSTSMQNYVTVKLDIDGEEEWVATYDHEDLDDQPIGIELALLGDVVVTGASMDTTSLWDFATVIYDDTTGNQVSVRRDALPGTSIDKPTAFAMDNSGNYYLTGSAVSDTSLLDIHTIKLDDSLNLEWTATFDGFQGNDEPNAIGIDSEGNVYVTGYSEEDTLKLFATIKYTDQGVEDWVNYESSSDSTGSALATDLRIDLEDQIYVTGSRENGSTYETYTVCYAADGTTQWEEVIEGGEGSGIQVNNFGDVFVTGRSFNGVNATYLAVKYSAYVRERQTVLDTANNPSHLKNEIIVGFAPESLIKNRIDNKKLPYGKASDFIISSVLTDMGNKLGIGNDINDAVMVKIYPNISSNDSLSITRLGDTIRTLDFWTDLILILPEGQEESEMDELEAADSLETLHPDIWFAHPNYLFTLSGTANDSLYSGEQFSLHEISPYPDADINIEEAWDIERGKESVRIGIYDSGIDWKHEDFGGDGLSMSTSVIKGGKSYFTGVLTKDAPKNDSTGHGTAVAGIIGALTNNDSVGIAGIAGGDLSNPNNLQKGVSLYSMQVFDPKEAPTSDIAAAIRDGASRTLGNEPALHIMNFSFGAIPTDQSFEYPVLKKAIYNAYKNQVVLVAARGNKGASGNPKEYPACYPDNWVLNIGASGDDGEWKNGTNNGSHTFVSSYSNGLDLIAPGAMNTIMTLENNTPNNQGYTSFNGTSAATPHVAGVASLMLSYMNQPVAALSNLAQEDVEQVLERTAEDKSATPSSIGYDQRSGWGLMDAGKALTMLEKPYYDILHLDGVPTFYDTIATNQTVLLEAEYVQFRTGEFYLVNVYKYQTVIPYHIGNDSIMAAWVRNSSSHGWSWDPLIDVLPYDACVIDSITPNEVYVSGHVYEVLSSGPPGSRFWWPLSYSNLTAASPKMSISLWVYNPNGTTSLSDQGKQNESTHLKVYPNPTEQNVTARIDLPKSSDALLQITDINGKMLWRQQQFLAAGKHEVFIPLKGLSTGFYFLSLSTKDFFLSQKVIKMN